MDGFNQYQISCPLSTGNSGGPVVNVSGEVIGVAAWSRLDAQNVNFAVSVEYLHALDPTRPTVAWHEPGIHMSQRVAMSEMASAAESKDDLAALRGYLKQAAGKRITIVVQEEEEQESRSFNFVVPE
jgi:hypothetical protein